MIEPMEDSEYYDDWLKNQSELEAYGVSFEEYEQQRLIQDYGLTDEEAYCGDED